MSLWSKVSKLLPFKGKRPVGYDLQGNAYFEFPNPNGGRAKRVVEYAEESRDYRQGTQQLPVQWTAWMSYTRETVPTLQELQADQGRQARLAARVREIEARDKAERIQQGYLLPDGSEPGETQVPRSLAAPTSYTPQGSDGVPGGVKEDYPASTRMRGRRGPPSQTLDELIAAEPSPYATGSGGTPHASARFAYPPRRRAPEPQPVTPQEADPEHIAPPAPKLDAQSVDPAELRRLAEEDTKRRMKESGVVEESGAAGVSGVGRGFRPRKRGE